MPYGNELKTSRYDFTLPPPKNASKSKSNAGNNGKSGEKECYYYYVYRKRIDPKEIKSPDDLPIPLIFRRNNAKLQKQASGGSLDDLSRIVSTKGSSRTLSPMKTSPTERKRSNSLPDVASKRVSPNQKNTRLKPLKKTPKSSPRRVKSTISAYIKGGSSPPSASYPEPGAFNTSIKSVPSLLNLQPEDGLQWSRHTTLIKTPFG